MLSLPPRLYFSLSNLLFEKHLSSSPPTKPHSSKHHPPATFPRYYLQQYEISPHSYPCIDQLNLAPLVLFNTIFADRGNRSLATTDRTINQPKPLPRTLRPRYLYAHYNSDLQSFWRALPTRCKDIRWLKIPNRRDSWGIRRPTRNQHEK